MNDVLKIFIVDDDTDDQELVQEALEMATVASTQEFFANGQDLIDRLEKTDLDAPDLILLDLNMPKMDGRGALNYIRSQDHLRHIPVVILSTSRSEDDVTGCYQNGANSYISKPARFDELLNAMEKLGDYWVQVVRLPKR